MDGAHGGMPAPRTCMLPFLNPTLIVVVFCHCWNTADASSLLCEPPYTEPYVRWCGRTAEVTPPPTRFSLETPARIIMNTTVMKFGGTSVADSSAFTNVAQIVTSHRDSQPVVVVSAMGGMTDALLASVERAKNGELETVLA